MSVMNRCEKLERQKPIIVKVENAVVKIYEGKSRGRKVYTLRVTASFVWAQRA
jgi:hypothetical protein